MHLLKIVIFGLLVIGFYTYFGVGYFPRVAQEGPPEEVPVHMESTEGEDLVLLGERVVRGKGACLLCHMPSGRAEVLDHAAAMAGERLKDDMYRGSAQSAVEYLLESLLKPSAYVVKGFGVAGSGDTLSPMPDVRNPRIDLSDLEIRAVVAYLQSLAGVDVTVTSGTPITYAPAGTQVR